MSRFRHYLRFLEACGVEFMSSKVPTPPPTDPGPRVCSPPPPPKKTSMFTTMFRAALGANSARRETYGMAPEDREKLMEIVVGLDGAVQGALASIQYTVDTHGNPAPYFDPSKLDPDRVYMPPGVTDPVVATPLFRVARSGDRLEKVGAVCLVNDDGTVVVPSRWGGGRYYTLMRPLPMPVAELNEPTAPLHPAGKNLLERVNREVERRRDAFYDDPRHSGKSAHLDPTIDLLIEVAAYIAKH